MAHPKFWGTTDTRNGLPTTTRESPDFSHGECQSKEQLEKEANLEKEINNEDYFSFNADYGIVAILGQSHPNEEPMKPETMIRNALGIEEGGSGVPLNKEKYLQSVEFWDKHVTVK